MRILAATGNRHKLDEFRSLLSPHGFVVLGSADVGGLPPVVEDADSFEGNAAKKAIEIALATGLPCFSDDSGLEVAALHGSPGIYSARYAGPKATDDDNVQLLLRRLHGIQDRRARFVCVIACADASGRLIGTARGECPGQITLTPQGLAGFGYDPVFIPEGESKTFAELGESIKNRLSHRQAALQESLRLDLWQQLRDATP
jgi:XTP/dITP diphosphohydrolase